VNPFEDMLQHDLTEQFRFLPKTAHLTEHLRNLATYTLRQCYKS